jgi:hypothetical protein
MEIKGKGKVLPVQASEAYRGIEGVGMQFALFVITELGKGE